MTLVAGLALLLTARDSSVFWPTIESHASQRVQRSLAPNPNFRFLLPSVAHAVETKRTPTADGWKEYLSSGSPFFADPEKLKKEIEDLSAFLSGPGASAAEADQKHLSEALVRMQRYSILSENARQCSAKEEGAKTYLDKILAGARAHAVAVCATNQGALENQLTRFKEIAATMMRSKPAESTEEALSKLTSTARLRARQNLAQILSQLHAAEMNIDDFTQRLNGRLKEIGPELSRLNREINKELAEKRYGADAPEQAQRLFNQKSGPYRAMYAGLVAAPGLNIVLTEPLLREVGFMKSEKSVTVKKRESFTRTVVSFGEHPSSLSKDKVLASITAAKADLTAALRRVEHDNETSLPELVLEYPVSVGESLMEARAEEIPQMMSKICEISAITAQKAQKQEELARQRDIALVAASFFTGGTAGALARGGASAAETSGASRIIHGVLTGAARAGAAGDAIIAKDVVVAEFEKQELLALHRHNPTLTRDPNELAALSRAVDEFEAARDEAIKTGVLTAFGSLGALKSSRLLAKDSDSPADIARAATQKMKTGPSAYDNFLGELSSCAIK